MPSTDQTGLMQLLESLSISAPASEFVETMALSNPLDLCRTSLAELLAGIVDCDLHAAYKSVQWPNNIFNGDLSVTVPRLCPGRRPAELSAQLVDKVREEIVKPVTKKLTSTIVSQRPCAIRPAAARGCPSTSLPQAGGCGAPSAAVRSGPWLKLWLTIV